jgi:hypothetical protein
MYYLKVPVIGTKTKKPLLLLMATTTQMGTSVAGRNAISLASLPFARKKDSRKRGIPRRPQIKRRQKIQRE